MIYYGPIKLKVVFNYTVRLISYHVNGHIKGIKIVINSLFLADELHMEAGTETRYFAVAIEMDFYE